MVLLAAAFAATACGVTASGPPPSPPAAGLTSSRAAEMAKPTAQGMSSTSVVLVSEKSGQYRDFRGGALAVSGDRWVWSVIFTGTFHQAGGPVGSSPLADQHTVMVIIDYNTGEFIQASVPASPPPD